MKVLLVAGARPNFMKIAPIFREALRHAAVDCRLVHTGQHYDDEMSGVFFEDLEIPEPSYFLGAGPGSHSSQTARIMVAFESICEEEKPDLVIVVGDVNSTLACSIAAKKLHIEVAHVEAGLRSFDRSMPEEINRLVTDSISDYFFVTEKSAEDNLLNEGKPPRRIHFVGHVMIDNLLHQLRKLDRTDTSRFSTYKVKKLGEPYVFLTLHRPSNVDRMESLTEIAVAMNRIAEEISILFPVHPRTRDRLREFNISLSSRVRVFPPLSFCESLFLWKDASLVFTDSGGLQEETTALGVPCVTLRENTERPITVELGTNVLGGTRLETIMEGYKSALKKKELGHSVPPKWDGCASQRIWNILLNEHGFEDYGRQSQSMMLC